MLQRSFVFHMVSSLLDGDDEEEEDGGGGDVLPTDRHPTSASSDVRKSISIKTTAPQSSWCSIANLSVLKIRKPHRVPTARQV
mmetsp:Transcript_57280/g.153373  ORF Transcript_57280/g.153373 Transcript_57280/m.153373 type:complete len:83 (+) Transcript_57280:1394-1642(+)